MGSSKLEFLLNGMPVGYFEESEYPRQDGRYRYVPYRSLGHYQMHTALEHGHVRCYYTLGSEKISFAVLDCPEYGILELADFRHDRKE